MRVLLATAAALAVLALVRRSGVSMFDTPLVDRWYRELVDRWGLEPAFARRAARALARVEQQGFRPRVFSGWRSLSEQAVIQADGRSQVAVSYHNATAADGQPAALALDTADARYGWGIDTDGSQNADKTARAAAYFATWGVAARIEGLHWGGDWRRTNVWADFGFGWDPGHVQAHPNSELAARSLQWS